MKNRPLTMGALSIARYGLCAFLATFAVVRSLWSIFNHLEPATPTLAIPLMIFCFSSAVAAFIAIFIHAAFHVVRDNPRMPAWSMVLVWIVPLAGLYGWILGPTHV